MLCFLLPDFPLVFGVNLTPLAQIVDRDVVHSEEVLGVNLTVLAQIVDRDVVHSEAEARRNTRIRDAMREKCVPQLVEAWLATLNTYAATHPQLACMCLEAVGKYVSWIDIGLVRTGPAGIVETRERCRVILYP